ncbi:MAG TPA: [LysW]-lysine hydrolase [Anaerolineaceae bacterium]|nr:[LysW]-lysine hydrolase [Anaerolineaceae bacterium]HPN51813.1 [LysW]-lysine hydrolase [Anaerolineaceae bacterium]
MTETLIELVKHYSPSGAEQGAATWLTGRMKNLGFDDAFVDGAGNAVGLMGQGARQMVLLGHIDTVPGEIPMRIEENVLYGRGSVDAKAPLACFVDAVAQVGAVEGWQFVVIGAVDEERNSDGARYAAGQYRPDFAIIGEPNRWDRISLGYKGLAAAEITLRRTQVHAASGEQTACEAAVDAWLAIKAYASAYNAEESRIFDQVIPTLHSIESGGDGFEQWATLKLSTRLPVSMPPEQWYNELEELAAGAEVIRKGLPVPAWACEKNTSPVRALLSAIRSQGGAPSFVYKAGTADLNTVAPVWQCPAVVYGPGDSSLDHTPNEHISLEEYTRAVQVLVTMLRKMTG